MVSFQSALTTDQMAESQELFTTQVSLRQTIKGIIPIIQRLFWKKNAPFESINNAVHHLSIVKGGIGASGHTAGVTADFWEIALWRFSKMPSWRQVSGSWKSDGRWILLKFFWIAAFFPRTVTAAWSVMYSGAKRAQSQSCCLDLPLHFQWQTLPAPLLADSHRSSLFKAAHCNAGDASYPFGESITPHSHRQTRVFHVGPSTSEFDDFPQAVL